MEKLKIIVPCFNEQEVIFETTKRLSAKINSMIENGLIAASSKIVYVNDGSKDNTLNLLKQIHSENKLVEVINLARNKGHQNALLAGLLNNDDADILISIDADLQDDIDIIDQMVLKYQAGYDVVYGVRKKRETDTFFKKNTALAFYKLMSVLGVDIVYNHADYRLLSKRVIQVLKDYKEVNLFLRGIIPLIGFNSTSVYYDRFERFAGESKYPLKKMLSFAFEGITSFSIKPIRLIGSLGFMIFIVSILMLIYSLVRYLDNQTVSGWASIIISIWGIGGLQLLSIGVIGEYIGKIYLESKARPRFVIESILRNE